MTRHIFRISMAVLVLVIAVVGMGIRQSSAMGARQSSTAVPETTALLLSAKTTIHQKTGYTVGTINASPDRIRVVAEVGPVLNYDIVATVQVVAMEPTQVPGLLAPVAPLAAFSLNNASTPRTLVLKDVLARAIGVQASYTCTPKTQYVTGACAAPEIRVVVYGE